MTDKNTEIQGIIPKSELIAALDPCCTWEQQEFESDVFFTSCNRQFIFANSTPEADGIEFCCYCGLPVKELLTATEGEAL